MNSKGVGPLTTAVRICPITRRTAPRFPLRTMVDGIPPFCRIELKVDSAVLVSLEAQIRVGLVLTDRLARPQFTSPYMSSAAVTPILRPLTPVERPSPFR